ncbi:acyl-CoA thioesterase [Sandaracinobacteroides saxicola]|uniref:Acyl-CoA thioesterase n=1 Tax=Sandaracinobacteroides saxicola TaxID=2759707 RepID=A0A7G5IFR3_9SPHN|nr:acyl-CoA thioesterase [Sandaracinobacteroides saxicola]QMW22205.1 acyl-CoA thioesterase [Sandaracinobacteroides saxicola]
MTFTLSLTPTADDIDELGHVNNIVYVRWLQEVGTAHWFAIATREEIDSLLWIVVRHEIDYRRYVMPGETLTAETWVGVQTGAKFDRHVTLTGADGLLRAEAKTTWALLEKESLRPMRVPKGLVTRFRGEG